jgi:hypothetical protein
MTRIGLVLALMFTLIASTADAQTPVTGLLGNYSKMMMQSLESVQRFCRYHDGVFVEGEMENQYECVKANNKTGFGVKITFTLFRIYPLPATVWGIGVMAALPRAQGNNAYEWIRKTGAWDSQSECPTGGLIKKCRRLEYERTRSDGEDALTTSQMLQFFWQPKGRNVIQGHYIMTPER